MRPRWAILAAFALLTAGFAYGFQSHRAHWFPFDLLRMVLEETGLADRPTVNLPAIPPAHMDALGYLSALAGFSRSRSKATLSGPFSPQISVPRESAA